MIDKIMEFYKEYTQKECYRFEIEEDVTPGIMDDKIGGIPYMPKDEEYPLDKNGRPMILLVQINLENIELENYPRKGILEIFIDRECDWPCDYKVKYFKNITECKTDFPDLDFENYIYEKPLKIKLVKDVEHLPMSDFRFYDVMSYVIEQVTGFVLYDEEIDDFFEEFETEIYDEMEKINTFAGNIGGYADFTQDDPRPIKGNEDKLESLIKVDSNLGHGIMIGDSGIIFSFISEKDLKNGDFENAIVDWDCC